MCLEHHKTYVANTEVVNIDGHKVWLNILYFSLPRFCCFEKSHSLPLLQWSNPVSDVTLICWPPLRFTRRCLIVFVNLQQWQRKAISLCCAVCEISTVVCNSLWKILVFLSYPTIREIIDCEDAIAISHDTCLSCWVLTSCSIFLEINSTLLYCLDNIQSAPLLRSRLKWFSYK